MTNKNKIENAQKSVNLSGISASANNDLPSHTTLCKSTLASHTNSEDRQYSATCKSVLPGLSTQCSGYLEPQPGTSSDGMMESNPVFLEKYTHIEGISTGQVSMLNIKGKSVTTQNLDGINTDYNHRQTRGVKRKRGINPVDNFPRKRQKVRKRMPDTRDSNSQRLIKANGLKRRYPPSFTHHDIEPVTKRLKLSFENVIHTNSWYAKLKATAQKQGSQNHIISERKRQAPITFFQVHSEPVSKKLKLSGREISEKVIESEKCPECCPCNSSDNLLTITPIPRVFQVTEPLLNKLLKLRSLHPSNVLKQCACKQRCDVRWMEQSQSMGNELYFSVLEDYWHSDLSICNYSWGPWKH